MKVTNSKKIVLMVVLTMIAFMFLGSIDVFAQGILEFRDQKLIPAETFIEEDIDYLKTLNNQNKIYNEIKALNELIDEVKSMYIPTNSGVKLYDAKTTEMLHALNGALHHRKEIVNNDFLKDIDYKKDYFFGDHPSLGNKIKGRTTSDDNEAALLEAQKIFNYIEIQDEYTKDIVVLIAPYHLEDIYGYAFYIQYSNNKPLYRSIAIGGRHNRKVQEYTDDYYENKNYEISDKISKEYGNTILHELGHTIDYYISHKNEDLKNKYFDLYPEFANIKDINNTNWSDSPAESFAEDFKVFFSNKLGVMSREPSKKRTIYEYNQGVEDIFTQLLKS